MYDQNIYAEMVDGIPSRMDKPDPSKNQLLGTPEDNLCEIAGRLCYRSLGKGRDSVSFHKNIIESGHFSVLEHARVNCLVEFYEFSDFSTEDWIQFANMPGIQIQNLTDPMMGRAAYLLGLNFRHLMEWTHGANKTRTIDYIFTKVISILSTGGSLIFPDEFLPYYKHSPFKKISILSENNVLQTPCRAQDFIHVPFYLSMSRNCSHEWVRHRMGAVSQVSTRYCDESQANLIEHPLITQYRMGEPDIHEKNQILGNFEYYSEYVDALSSFIQSGDQTVSATHARKQARGAARGYLNSNLQTEMIYTCSISNWQHILNMRMTDHADAEIRILCNHILNAFRQSKYHKFFDTWTTRPALDGIGLVINSVI